MKKHISVLLTLTLSATSLFAQGPVISDNWKVKSFGISFGQDQDMVSHLDQDFIISSISDKEVVSDLQNIEFDNSYVSSMICENLHYRLNLTLLPPKLKNTELNIALLGIFGRIDMVGYSSNWYDPDYSYLNFDLHSNEIDLEATLLRRIPLLGKTFNFYVGAGTNVGVSFANEVYINGYQNQNGGFVIENNETQAPVVNEALYYGDSYKAKSSVSQRLFGQLGLSALMGKRFELGYEFRRGIGYRATPGSSAAFTNLTSNGIAARWHLR